MHIIRYLTLLSLILSINLLFSPIVSGEIFTDSGLVDIPTGKVLNHGIFEAGVNTSFLNEPLLSRDVTALRVNFGMFDRLEIGLLHLLDINNGLPLSSLAHLKAQLIAESGLTPNIALGVENLGDKIPLKWKTYQPQSVFLVISKTFTIPKLPIFIGHIGIGNHRFASIDQNIGVFGGVSMGFHPSFTRGDIELNLEYDGKGINAGLRHIADTGLQVAVGVDTLNKPDETRYLLSVSWTNQKIIEQIAGANRLARQAARLASQAKNRSYQYRNSKRIDYCFSSIDSITL